VASVVFLEHIFDVATCQGSAGCGTGAIKFGRFAGLYLSDGKRFLDHLAMQLEMTAA
jgi:hypothetical protein